ncbi:MJ0042 family finger-like domain-containing protein [Salinihabitans flavidus]|uniref:MJ0042 family finger-like domain-containing protein n=1 Tax=Salinihabitans flavidus TaxID=569882 RepID=A0A1H8R801_9RHOB|nr:zinc-ribbon domain-containing protein [Salinihabitans flavidus]SEO62542.1 MJ0042 family finger-like domain-containing protein [Salinihabitans flavidus]
MRLICPNCGAQYEVPDQVIPQDGRDVECSSCGQTWFQAHPDDDDALSGEIGGSVPDAPADDPFEGPVQWPQEPPAPATSDDDGSAPVADAPPETAVDDAGSEQAPDDRTSPVPDDWESDEPQSEAESWEDPATAHQSTPPAGAEDHIPGEEPAAPGDDGGDTLPPDTDQQERPAAPPRRRLDPAVADVLREEAEREARARAEEAASGLESQPDLGLDTSETEEDRRARETRRRMKHLRGLPDDARTPDAEIGAEAIPASSRRELLPDIEEINSTLRSTEDRAHATRIAPVSHSETWRRVGFRIGFGFMMLIAAGLIFAYLYAPSIATFQPQFAPMVDHYVAWVNDSRIWLDDQVTQMMLWLESKAATANG